MLMASGLLTDFIRGFKIMGQKINTWSLFDLKKTEIALKLMIKLLLLSGLLGSMIGTVAMISSFSDISKIGPNLAVASLTLLYSVLTVFILLPVQAKVRAIILTMDKEYSYEKTID
jgi:flagellar motor component MotA